MRKTIISPPTPMATDNEFAGWLGDHPSDLQPSLEPLLLAHSSGNIHLDGMAPGTRRLSIPMKVRVKVHAIEAMARFAPDGLLDGGMRWVSTGPGDLRRVLR